MGLAQGVVLASLALGSSLVSCVSRRFQRLLLVGFGFGFQMYSLCSVVNDREIALETALFCCWFPADKPLFLVIPGFRNLSLCKDRIFFVAGLISSVHDP